MTERGKKCLGTYDHTFELATAVKSLKSINIFDEHDGTHFYLPINAPNCTKLRRLKSTCINILKDN